VDGADLGVMGNGMDGVGEIWLGFMGHMWCMRVVCDYMVWGGGEYVDMFMRRRMGGLWRKGIGRNDND